MHRLTGLHQQGVDVLFFFGTTHELLTLAREAVRLTWAPYVLLAGSLADRDLWQMPLAFQNKIFLAYATAPSDHSRAGVQEFSTLQRQHRLPRGHLPVQIATEELVRALARVQGIGKRTVDREWQCAKAWLLKQLSDRVED